MNTINLPGVTLKEIPPEERPRERLLKMGPEALKTSELIAIIIKHGSRKNTALDVGEKIINKFSGNLKRLNCASIKELYESIDGMGPVKASQLLAAFELGKRITSFSEEEKPVINTPDDVAHLLMSEMRYYRKEVFKIILLNTKNRLIKIETISSGILDASLVHPREVFYSAIQESASSLILVHNHPSGNVSPSRHDIEITKNIVEAGKIMDIEVVDHIIIGDGKYLSLREKNFI